MSLLEGLAVAILACCLLFISLQLFILIDQLKRFQRTLDSVKYDVNLIKHDVNSITYDVDSIRREFCDHEEDIDGV